MTQLLILGGLIAVGLVALWFSGVGKPPAPKRPPHNPFMVKEPTIYALYTHAEEQAREAARMFRPEAESGPALVAFQVIDNVNRMHFVVSREQPLVYVFHPARSQAPVGFLVPPETYAHGEFLPYLDERLTGLGFLSLPEHRREEAFRPALLAAPALHIRFVRGDGSGWSSFYDEDELRRGQLPPQLVVLMTHLRVLAEDGFLPWELRPLRTPRLVGFEIMDQRGEGMQLEQGQPLIYSLRPEGAEWSIVSVVQYEGNDSLLDALRMNLDALIDARHILRTPLRNAERIKQRDQLPKEGAFRAILRFEGDVAWVFLLDAEELAREAVPALLVELKRDAMVLGLDTVGRARRGSAPAVLDA